MALINDYYESKGLSRSAITRLLQSPAHYQAWLRTDKQTSDMRVGTLVHYMLLTPERLKPEIAIHTETKTLESVSGKLFMAVAARNRKWACTRDEYNRALKIYRAVKANKEAWDLLKIPAKRERLVQVKINGVLCKALIDLSARNFILDVKTTGDKLSTFQYSVESYSYHIQAAWYGKLAELVDGVKRPFIFLPIEKDDPHGCYPVEIEEDWINYGWQQCLKGIEIWKDCVQRDFWPNYDFGIRKVSMPYYVRERIKEQEYDLPSLHEDLAVQIVS